MEGRPGLLELRHLLQCRLPCRACRPRWARDFGLSQIGAFKETGLFPIYLTGPLGRTFNYADGGRPRHFRAADVLAGAPVQAAGPVPGMSAGRPHPSALDLLWYDPAGSQPESSRSAAGQVFSRSRSRRAAQRLGEPAGAVCRLQSGRQQSQPQPPRPRQLCVRCRGRALGHGPGRGRLQPAGLFRRPAVELLSPPRRRPEHSGHQPGRDTRPGPGGQHADYSL